MKRLRYPQAETCTAPALPLPIAASDQTPPLLSIKFSAQPNFTEFAQLTFGFDAIVLISDSLNKLPALTMVLGRMAVGTNEARCRVEFILQHLRRFQAWGDDFSVHRRTACKLINLDVAGFAQRAIGFDILEI